jgi:hypothetical protein
MRSRLSAVIEAMNSACKYSGEFDYIYQRVFSNGYIWRGFNALTGQAIVIAWTLPGGRFTLGAWENGLLSGGVLTRPVKNS